VFGLEMQHIILLLLLGVLLFGKRLPEVARSVGKVFMEFKKSLRGFEEHLQTGNFPQDIAAPPPAAPLRPPQRVVAKTPKFEDVPSTPPSPIV